MFWLEKIQNSDWFCNPRIPVSRIWSLMEKKDYRYRTLHDSLGYEHEATQGLAPRRHMLVECIWSWILCDELVLKIWSKHVSNVIKRKKNLRELAHSDYKRSHIKKTELSADELQKETMKLLICS
jgi:hypothetical protein